MSPFLEKLRLYTQNECHLEPASPILVGVSGGPDSLCLLYALHALKYPLVVAHFNHQLRDDAHADANFVQETASRLDLPFVGGTGNVTEFSRAQGFSIEEAARALRYPFLFAQAQHFQAQAVAVGHNGDDQTETVLMHFLRGAGLDGLKGMLPHTILPVWDTEIPLVRPLLAISRAEIEAFCQEMNLRPREDATNADTTYFRNRLRHELIPTLETFNPRFRETIRRTAQTLAADQDALHQQTDRAWAACLLRAEPTTLALAWPPFRIAPLGIQRRVLRRAIETLRPGLRDVDFAAIERVLAFLAIGKEGVCEVTGNLRVFVEGARFWIAEDVRDLPTDEWPQMDGGPRPLGVGETIRLRAGREIRAATVPAQGPIPEGPARVWVDAGDLEVFTVRARRPGDVFQPLGMDKSVKLAEFFINEKIPRRARDSWPLVCAGDEIVWIPGVRLGERFRVQVGRENILELTLKRSD